MKFFPRSKQAGLTLLAFALISGSLGVTPTGAVSAPKPSNSGSNSQIDSEPLAARAHLVVNASAWGIDPLQFRATEAISVADGISVVRFTQFINNVEVANSLLALTVSANGSLLSYTISTSDFSKDMQPLITQEQATTSLKKSLASRNRISINEVSVSKIELVIVDSGLVDGVPAGNYLAWRATTSISRDTTSLAMTYLSADGKKILSNLPFVRGITADPFVCDLQFDVGNPDYVLPTGVTEAADGNRKINISSSNSLVPLCGLNTSGRGVGTTTIASENIIRTWNFFNKVLGQDINEEKYLGNISLSVNGDKKPRISSFINVCATNYECPIENAFWMPWESDDCRSGACSGIFLGQGFDLADDVIAHELAHGVTFSLAFNAAMEDKSETAALSEAISDIFGEAMDQLYVAVGEAPDTKWKIGEDVAPNGYRNMRKPSVAKIDKNWKSGDSHDNNGPVNKLAYLLANGGKVGTVEIKPLGSVTKDGLCDSKNECTGVSRMAQLVFAATSNLTASASYFDFGRELNAACMSFVKNKTKGFSLNSCAKVRIALQAQGFTDSSIRVLTSPKTSAKSKPIVITARMKAITGSKVKGQKVKLQILKKGKWSTFKSAKTDADGNVKFAMKLKQKKTYSYRIISYSYSGLYSVTSSVKKIRVS